MTNTIANPTAIPPRDTADAAHLGARGGHSSSAALSDLASSFQNVLYGGARIDAKELRASMSLAHSAAQDWLSPPETEFSSWHPRNREDATASDVDIADDYGDWHASDRGRETETRETDASTSTPEQPVSDADSSVIEAESVPLADEFAISGSSLAGASYQSTRPTSTATPGIGTTNGNTDPAGPHSNGIETEQSPVNVAQRAGANAVSSAANESGGSSPEAASTARQADELAKSLPVGKDLKLSVTLSKSGDSLFSHPASTLAATSVAHGQSIGTRPGQPAVGASAKAGFVTAQNSTRAAMAGQAAGQANPPSTIQANGGSGAGNLQLHTGAEAQETNLAAAQPRNAGTSASAPTGPFADITGIGSSGAAQGATRGAPGPASPAAPPTPPQPPVAEQVSVQISKAVKAGVDRIDIQLRPKELGRIDVRLELAGGGRVSANVTVDNRETLELLKTDARALEHALDDAGLKADSNSLNFNLRGQDGRQSGSQLSRSSHASGVHGNGQDEMADDSKGRTLGDYSRGGLSADGRVNIEI